MWVCGRCASENPDNAKFCSQCGQSRENNAAKGQKKPRVFVYVLLSLLLLLAVGGIWLFQNHAPNGSGTGPKAQEQKTQEEGKWVETQTVTYYNGVISSQRTKTYGKYGLEEVEAIYYNNGQIESSEHTYAEYDENGELSKRSVYDSQSGALLYYYEYTRLSDGHTLTNRYAADGELKSSEESYPEKELHDVSISSYAYKDGEKILFSEREYDHVGNLVKETLYDTDGMPMSVTESVYDEMGLVTKRLSSLYLSAALLRKTEETYLYEEDVLVRSLEVDQGSGEVTLYEYTYDPYGNCIRTVGTCNGEERYRYESVYQYYINGAVVEDYSDYRTELIQGGSASTPKAEYGSLNPTIVEEQRIAVHRGWVLALTDQGKVLGAGAADVFGADMCATWSDIVAIDAAVNGSERSVLGLKKDGTVVAAGWSVFMDEYKVSDWTDVVQIKAVIDNAYGLRADGTVLSSGSASDGMLEVGHIKQAAKLFTGEHSANGVLVLNKDQTVDTIGGTVPTGFFANASFAAFKQVIDINLGWSHAYGVTSDGRVVSTRKLPPAIAAWTDVSKVFSHDIYSGLVIGLRSDGTVLAYTDTTLYDAERVASEVRSWTGIKDIVILNGFNKENNFTVIGLKEDGSLVSTGGVDLSGFDNLYSLYAYDDSYTHFAYLVGVRKDGTVVSNDPAVKDEVAGWKLF